MNEHPMREPGFVEGFRYLRRDASMLWEKHGGKICTIAGTSGLIFTSIHSCRRTYKLHDSLRKRGERLHSAYSEKIDGESGFKRFTRIAKETACVAAETAKDYLPDIVAGALSAYATRKGWQVENRHYKQAAAMVGVLAADFANYRMNVIEEQGKEADLRYMNTRKERRGISSGKADGKETGSGNKDFAEGEEITVQMNPRHLRILYSEHTTPMVWSPAHPLRINHLEQIVNRLNHDLMYGGYFTVNDVRREFYGKKGDVPEGGLFGRVWDPGNPAHPKRGRMVDIHYEDDQDFMDGIKDWCWIEIEIDEEALIDTVFKKNEMEFTPVETV